ncbi:winged helix-turn-helix transcriptional regulator [Ralstonia solanacearum]|uniref:winged helix-turn-helix transcriptional regulator n=1 Tax=Ralstonia solanacearum TaxID=305 RepID=UPI0018D0FD15|nr:helix-turn-helix domain-containing protein [Ralstonia solanacearum]
MHANAPTPDNKDSLAARLSRGDVLSAACPAREVLSYVTSRWGVLVLIALRSGTFRYSELRRRIGGVSEKMLAQTLQALELDGFVKRVSLPVVPPHVEYSLTAMGEEVSQRVEGLTSWIESNLPMVLAARSASSRTKA